MRELVTAFGLVLVIEGIAYAFFSDRLRAMMARLLEMPDATVRWTGAAMMAAGVFLVWLIRG